MLVPHILSCKRSSHTAPLTEALSILLSILSLISSRSANKKLLKIESGRDKKAEEAESKAILVAARHSEQYEQRPGMTRTRTHLEITNSGLSEATDVQIFFDNAPAAEHKYFSGTISPEISTLGAGATKKLRLKITLRSPTPKEVSLLWKNKDGTTGEFRTSF